MKGYMSGKINVEIAMPTLAANTGVLVAVNDVVVEKTLCSSVKCTYTLKNLTPEVDVGPFRIFVAHSEYSLAQIEAWIESSTSWDAGNLVEKREVQRRLIREIGTFQSADLAGASFVLNNGRPITTKLNWMLQEGDTLAFVGYNTGSSAASTTIPDINVDGHANLWTK